MISSDIIKYTIKNEKKYIITQEIMLNTIQNSNISCLTAEYNNNEFIYNIYESNDKGEIHRSLFVFENIKKIIDIFQIKFAKKIYFFHNRSDACQSKNLNYPLISHSRKIGYDEIILWPLTITKNTFIHYDLNYYKNERDNIIWNNKRNKFIFKGMNSGNPFSCVKYQWNYERCSRVDLLLEYLKLPQELQEKGEITFDYIYPNMSELMSIVDNDEKIFEKFGKILLPGKNIDDLRKEIKLVLNNVKPRQKLNYLFDYKYIICPEGFDVSSGLNWVLCSNSLAIVPPFHYENTIINSDYLKPYIHYVPIEENFSNLREILEWCMMNDEKCKEIIKNANDYSNKFLSEDFMINYLKDIILKIIDLQE
jgi:hypothetical protein